MVDSIIQTEKECLLCKTTLNLHRHHIFRGTHRNASEEYGLTCYLCAAHHNMSDYSVHNNEQLNEELKKLARHVFEEKYGEDKFIEIFGS